MPLCQEEEKDNKVEKEVQYAQKRWPLPDFVNLYN